MILHNQHCHSEFSMDSEVLLEDYYKECQKLGCSYFITTEHLDFHISNHKEKRIDWVIDTPALRAKLNKIKTDNGPLPLIGIEVGYRKDYLEEIKSFVKENGPYDLINLSIHDNGIIEFYFKEGFKQYGVRKMLDSYYQIMLEAVTNYDDFNVLSHLDYGYKTVYNMKEEIEFFDDIDIIKQILSIIIQKGKALEINIKVQQAFKDSHVRDLLRLYKSLGGEKLTLSTDAHELSLYYLDMDKYMKIIKEEGFNYLCYYIKRKEYHYDI